MQETEGVWSGRRGSNPRHSAWEADTLPAELLPLGATPVYAAQLRTTTTGVADSDRLTRCACHHTIKNAPSATSQSDQLM
jgi:hypothetical protein